MTARSTACELTGGWLVTVDYRSGRTNLLAPAAASRWRRASATAPVKRVPWEPSWSTHEVPVGWEPPPSVPLRILAVAGAGLLLTLIAAGPRRGRIRRLVRLVRIASALSRKSAPSTLAHELTTAMRHYGFLPVRVACLESSVAVVVASALIGRGVTWHHGVLPDPIVLHAWVSVDGVPVAEPPSTLRCATLLTIPNDTEDDT